MHRRTIAKSRETQRREPRSKFPPIFNGPLCRFDDALSNDTSFDLPNPCEILRATNDLLHDLGTKCTARFGRKYFLTSTTVDSSC